MYRGWANPGTKPPSGHSEDYSRGYRDGASKSNSNLATQDPTHCDIEGWPKCYDIGFVRGWDNAGTEPPSGHSEDYSRGYRDGASKSIEYSNRHQHFATHVEELPLNNPDGHIAPPNPNDGVNTYLGYYDSLHDLICFVRSGSNIGSVDPTSAELLFPYDAAPRHQIGDTKYHLIEYTAVSTSRFREYFLQKEGNQDVKFTRESNPVKVHVPASTRPITPQLIYVIPTFGWQRETHTNLTRSFRMGGGLRIYMNRPWFSSGSGELLGVTTFSASFTSTSTITSTTNSATATTTTITTTNTENPPYSLPSEDWKPFITQWGQDPIWQSAQLGSIPDSSCFIDADAVEYAVELEDRLSNGNPRLVDVAAYKPEFDEARKLWYCDITVDSKTATYSPFIRLALVRYQPHALKEAKISRVVLADFAQVTPERAVMVTSDPYQPGDIRIVISGPAPEGPKPASYGTPPPTNPVDKPLQITATLQERDLTLETDLEWQDASKDVYTINIENNDNPLSTDPNLSLWAGSIHFNKTPKPNQYRILIQEHEYISADYTITTQGDNPTIIQPSRLIYAETILLDEALLSPPPSTASKTSTQPPDPTHCDKPGWPKCYGVGFVRGWANPGTEPPSGHSEDYSRGYRDGASKSNSNLATQDPTHCDIEGWPKCYDIGFVRGWDNAGTEPPIGHSEDYSKGYRDGANKSISPETQ